jgi:hypothetical protein
MVPRNGVLFFRNPIALDSESILRHLKSPAAMVAHKKGFLMAIPHQSRSTSEERFYFRVSKSAAWTE